MIDDYLYLIPAMTFTVVLALSSGVYMLYFLFQLHPRHRRRGIELRRLNVTFRYFSRVATIAGLILLERIVYRHAYPFALGLELVLLKVTPSPAWETDYRERCRLHTCCFR